MHSQFADRPHRTAAEPDVLALEYPVLDIPSALRRSVAEALQRGETHYTDVAGVEPVRRELAETLARRGIPVSAGDVLLTAGDQESRFVTIHGLGRAGGALALPTVVHPGARQAAAVRAGAPLSIVADLATGLITTQGVRVALEAGATTIYLENPGRLTGKLIDPAELADIAALIAAADARAICDEGLADWLPDDVEHTSLASLPGMAVRTLCFGLPWGGMGLEAWGLGYVAGPSELIAQCRSVKQMISICTNTVSQWSAAGASQIRALEHAGRMAVLRERYNEAAGVAARAGLQLVPGEALASLAVIAAPGSAVKLAQSGFAVMDGADFGAPDRVRIVVSPDGAAARALLCL